MMLGAVVGTVVCGQRADGFDNVTYRIVEPCDATGEGTSGVMVAFDMVGTNEGDVVMLSQGSASRQTRETFDTPVDAIIVGIIDMIDQHGSLVYKR